MEEFSVTISLISGEAKRDLTEKLFKKLLDGYKKDFLPRLNESEPVKVRFEFELITIKEVVSSVFT